MLHGMLQMIVFAKGFKWVSAQSAQVKHTSRNVHLNSLAVNVFDNSEQIYKRPTPWTFQILVMTLVKMKLDV